MEKDQKILIGLIAVVFLIAVGISVYFLAFKKDNSSDAIKFKTEYESFNDKKYDDKEKYLNVNIEEDNLYVYKSDVEILDVLENQTGVVLFGFSKCPYCRSIVNILNEVAKDNKIEKIYYVDILNIRDSYEIMDNTAVRISNGSSSYYKLLEKLDEYLTGYYITDENDVKYNTGVKRIYAPTVVVVKNGEVIGFYEGTIDTAEYNKDLTKDEEKELKKIYTEMIKKLNDNNCSNRSC